MIIDKVMPSEDSRDPNEDCHAVVVVERSYVVAGTTDLRKSSKGLDEVIKYWCHHDPRPGDLYIFNNKALTSTKTLIYGREEPLLGRNMISYGDIPERVRSCSGYRLIELAADELEDIREALSTTPNQRWG